MLDLKEPALAVDGVFSGTGSVLIGGIEAYFEACNQLQARGLKFSRVYGTSGGSAPAAIHGYGLSPADVLPALIDALKGNKLLDISFMPWKGLGVFKGEALHETLKRILPYKMGSSVNHWACFAVDVETGETIEYSSWGTPDVWAYDAVYRSMCIPFLWRQHENKVDGGVTSNFALNAADKWIDGTLSVNPTIGFRLGSNGSFKGKPKTFIGLLLRLIEIWIKLSTGAHISSKHWQNVCSWTTDKSAMDFDMSEEDQKDIRADANIATRLFFEKVFSRVGS